MPPTKGTAVRKVAADQIQLTRQAVTAAAAAGGPGPSDGDGTAASAPGTPQFGSWSVRADSLTPYTDATSAGAGGSKRGRAGTGGGGGGGRSSAAVRRPMNAFMVWSQVGCSDVKSSTKNYCKTLMKKTS